MDELTPGQAAQLARNEEVIDRTAEELEELEEALSESVAESLRGRRQQAEQQPARKKKRCAGSGPEGPGGRVPCACVSKERRRPRAAAPAGHGWTSGGRGCPVLERLLWARHERAGAADALPQDRPGPRRGRHPCTMPAMRASGCASIVVIRVRFMVGFPTARPARRRRVDPEEEAAAAASSGDDEFFDRTAGGRARKLRAAAAPALDAATLYGRKARLALAPSCLAGARSPGWRPVACSCYWNCCGVIRAPADNPELFSTLIEALTWRSFWAVLRAAVIRV
jgi:hypothetical protein